jgi:hypothetical protein
LRASLKPTIMNSWRREHLIFASSGKFVGDSER